MAVAPLTNYSPTPTILPTAALLLLLLLLYLSMANIIGSGPAVFHCIHFRAVYLTIVTPEMNETLFEATCYFYFPRIGLLLTNQLDSTTKDIVVEAASPRVAGFKAKVPEQLVKAWGLPSGFIKHGCFEIPQSEWRFLARNITYFYGPFSILRHV